MRLSFILALVVLVLADVVASSCASRPGARHPGVKVAPPVAAAAPPPLAPLPPPAVSGALRVGLSDETGTRIVTLSLEDYVLGAVRAELPPSTLRDSSLSRMIEVQAIVSRTFALASSGRHAAEGFDVCDGTHCQVYRAARATESEGEPVSLAVAATRGLVITYEGRLIQALFHANCGGYTASAASVWGGRDLPYLRAVPDWFCSRKTAPAGWTFSADASAVLRALAVITATDVGEPLLGIEVAERDASGRAVLVALSGARTLTVRAEAFRSVMNQAFGERAIRSTRFTIASQDDRYDFSGTGSGHGVGLCQAGALERVRAGESVADIIAHYYPGTVIQPMPAGVIAPHPGS